MIYAIAKIDTSARARLSWIQSFAASFGIVPKPIYGHITLCPQEENNILAAKDALADCSAFTVEVPTLEILPNAPVIAAMVSKNSALENIRSRLTDESGWIPHIELLRDTMMDLSWIRSAMTQMFTPFTATIDRIEFVRDTGRGFEVLDAADLTPVENA